ncbi:hypothetical protein ONZ45_g18084 [Pleurotus djamor]|nr:hypothetical protein ONZ45_g18084 [Pleurotus djamor]
MLFISQKLLRALALLCNLALASSGKTEYFQDASSLDRFPGTSNPSSPNPLAHSEPRLGSWNSDHAAPHTSEKYLLVHFVVGLAQSYVLENWVHDFSLASTKSIDAFVLNVGSEPWVRPLVDTAFRGALQTPIKLALSLDFSVIPCSSDNDKAVIVEFIESYIGQTCYFKYAGRPLLSTFGGERCTFGKGNSNDGWNAVLGNLSTRVVFVPAFFIYAGAYNGYTGVDGVMEWNAAWPMGNQDISFERDQAIISQIGKGLLYLAAISPWFFTHYVNGRNGGKNFVYRSENWLLATRWEEIVQNRDKVDMVEMISWNDYGESHYIGPVTGTQPEWDAWWANGFDHQGQRSGTGLIYFYLTRH